MLLENSFQLDVPPQAAWEVLLDVPRIVPCIPGAELVEVLGPEEWLVRVKVKLGSMGMDFKSNVKMDQRDDVARSVRLSVNGRDVSGRGMVTAAVSSAVHQVDDRTVVSMTTDLQIAGKMAQFGRGIVADVSASLVDSFADCLRAELAETTTDDHTSAPPPGATGERRPPPKTLSVFSLFLAVLRRRLGRLFSRRSTAQM